MTPFLLLKLLSGQCCTLELTSQLVGTPTVFNLSSFSRRPTYFQLGQKRHSADGFIKFVAFLQNAYSHVCTWNGKILVCNKLRKTNIFSD